MMFDSIISPLCQAEGSTFVMIHFDKKQNDAAFFEIVENMDFHDEREKTLISLEPFKTQILGILDMHLRRMPSAMYADEEGYRMVCNRLTGIINGEATSIGESVYKEHVISEGEITFAIESKAYKDVCVLPGDFTLEGDVDYLRVGSIPDLSKVRHGMGSDEVTTNSVPVKPFGLAIVLKNVTLLHPNGSLELLEPGFEVSIPVDYEHLPLKKVVNPE